MTYDELVALGLPTTTTPRIRRGNRYEISAPGLDEPAYGAATTRTIVPDGGSGRASIRLDGTETVVLVPTDWLRPSTQEVDAR
jgi:hypothetical protein